MQATVTPQNSRLLDRGELVDFDYLPAHRVVDDKLEETQNAHH